MLVKIGKSVINPYIIKLNEDYMIFTINCCEFLMFFFDVLQGKAVKQNNIINVSNITN
jgi:hypothetical protein